MAVEQHVPITAVVTEEKRTKINKKIAELESDDKDDASYTTCVVELVCYEMKDDNFTKNVKSVIDTLKKELGSKSRTAIKHFCAYICLRLDTRDGESYVPTNNKATVDRLINIKTYQKWLLNKVAISQTQYEMMISKGNAWHWRTYVKDTYAASATQTIIETLPMFPHWLAEINVRKKTKQDPPMDHQNSNENQV